MVNGTGGTKGADLNHLAAISKILNAALDPSSFRTKQLFQLSHGGTTQEIRQAAAKIKDLLLDSVELRKLDFTAVASCGVELLQEVNQQLTELSSQLRQAQEELSRRPTVDAFQAFETRLAECSQTIEQKTREIEALTGKLTKVESDLKQANTQKAAVSSELITAQARIQEKEDKITALSRERGEIEEARQAAIRHQETLERQRQEAVTRQTALQGEVNDIKLRIGDAERIRKERAETERGMLRLRGQVGRLERELGEAIGALEQLRNDPEIAGLRSQNAEFGRLLGEKEAELAQARQQIAQQGAELAAKEFEHSQRSGEQGEIVRQRTAERDAAIGELTTARTEVERFRQWANFGVQANNEIIPRFRQEKQDLEGVLARLRQQLQETQEEAEAIRSKPRKLPPALKLLAELKEKDPKAYQFIVKVLTIIASKMSDEVKKTDGRPIAARGEYLQKTQPSPQKIQAVEIDEFQNRAIFILEMVFILDRVAREIRAKGKDAGDVLDKLHSTLAKSETPAELKVELVEFFEKILENPSLVISLMGQTIDKNTRQGLLSEISDMAEPANENEFHNRAESLYRTYSKELKALSNDPYIEEPTRVTITQIITAVTQTEEKSPSFPEEPTTPEGRPGKKGFWKRLLGR